MAQFIRRDSSSDLHDARRKVATQSPAGVQELECSHLQTGLAESSWKGDFGEEAALQLATQETYSQYGEDNL